MTLSLAHADWLDWVHEIRHLSSCITLHKEGLGACQGQLMDLNIEAAQLSVLCTTLQQKNAELTRNLNEAKSVMDSSLPL